MPSSRMTTRAWVSALDAAIDFCKASEECFWSSCAEVVDAASCSTARKPSRAVSLRPESWERVCALSARTLVMHDWRVDRL